MIGNILLLDPNKVDVLYAQIESGLRKRGHHVVRFLSMVDFHNDARAKETADVLFALGQPITRDLMASMPKLRAVMSPVTGTDGIDEAAASELGIIVGNGQIPENYESMAEATIMLILACLYDLRESEAILRDDRPHPNPVSARMIKGKVLGLIGFGQIARAMTRRLTGWDMQIQTYTPRLRAPLPPEVKRVELEELLRTSDVVSVLCPLSPETRGMLGAERLALLKQGAIFINTARGKIVDENALYELTRTGHISRIAVDVFDIEPPPPSNILRQLPIRNAILTPHLVGHTAEVLDAVPVAAIESVERIMIGEPPLYVRNPQIISHWKRRWS